MGLWATLKFHQGHQEHREDYSRLEKWNQHWELVDFIADTATIMQINGILEERLEDLEHKIV